MDAKMNGRAHHGANQFPPTGMVGGTDWIQTYTGRKVDPLNIRPDDLDLEDIGHALSCLCRFNGHCARFYSVGEHSLNVWQLVAPEHRLCALLHDAAEVYMGDIVRPVKKRLGVGWAEERIAAAICSRFDVCFDFACCKDADDRMLATEARQLMGVADPRRAWQLNHDPLEEREMPLHMLRWFDCPPDRRTVKDLWLKAALLDPRGKGLQ